MIIYKLKVICLITYFFWPQTLLNQISFNNINMEIRKQLLELFLLKDELEYFHKELSDSKEISFKFRLIKQNLIVLNTFLESLSKFNIHIKENKELKERTRNIRKKGGLINHMRNKIGGHLDNDVLIRSAQWTPYIFHKNAKENRELQISLCYKSILEASINSYIDISKDEMQKEFGNEIDFFYPPDETIFYNYLGKINFDSIEWIKLVIETIEKDFVYFDNKEMFVESRIAGLTDFNLKKKFELPDKNQLKNNEFIELSLQALTEKDNSKKRDLLNKLSKKLEEKIKHLTINKINTDFGE